MPKVDYYMQCLLVGAGNGMDKEINATEIISCEESCVGSQRTTWLLWAGTRGRDLAQEEGWREGWRGI